MAKLLIESELDEDQIMFEDYYLLQGSNLRNSRQSKPDELSICKYNSLKFYGSRLFLSGSRNSTKIEPLARVMTF